MTGIVRILDSNIVTRLLVVLALAVSPLRGEDKPAVEPKVTALVPLAVPQGFAGTLRLRGFAMKEGTEVRVEGSAQPDKIEIKEKKDAGVPAGMTGDLLGDSEIVVDLALAADFPVGPMSLVVVVGERSAAAVALLVLAEDRIAEEAEPNNGFRNARKLEPGRTVTGLINGQRDVDVFEIAGVAGQRLEVSAIASGVASLLDPLLTAFDAGGNQLGTRDDTDKANRDGTLEVTPTADGPVFITVQDAHDYGSEWHAYRLEVAAPTGVETPRGAVSFAREVWPVLRAHCVSCHRPAKLKGGLDLTSFAALAKGGKHGAIVKAGAPEESALVDAIGGDEPEMPPEGERLNAAEVELLARWVAEGAADDTPEGGLGTRQPSEPPIYRALPAVPALAFSPDGALLAVAGHHEIVLHRGDGSGIIGRWGGDSRRLETLRFSRDGRFLAACGGAPSEFGEIQVWDVASGTLARSIRAGADTLYGVSWSDDGSRLAAGGADKRVRAFDSATGAQVMECDNHLDWVFGTAFVLDGSRLVSVSRDRGVKLIDVGSGHLVDDAARPREAVLALARHPAEDIVAFTGAEGKVRLHRMAPRGGRLKEGDDREESAIREFEHMATPLHAVAFNADGTLLACGGLSGEVRVFQTADGQRKASLASAGAPVFDLAFHPADGFLATAGGDGLIRFHDPADGKLLKAFPAVPLASGL